MISLVHRRKTPFPDVRYYDVGTGIVVFDVLVCRRALEGRNGMGHGVPKFRPIGFLVDEFSADLD